MAWGFGFACLIQVAPSLALWHRLREGLGNRGLDGERRTLRITSHLLRLAAWLFLEGRRMARGTTVSLVGCGGCGSCGCG